MKTINKLKCRIALASIPKPIKVAIFNFLLVIWVLFIVGQAVKDWT